MGNHGGYGPSVSAADLPDIHGYRDLAAWLRHQVNTGVWRPGQRIPAEHDLTQMFGLARPTVRRATELLIAEGLLRAVRGSGTYVRDPGEVATVEIGVGWAVQAKVAGELERQELQVAPTEGPVTILVVTDEHGMGQVYRADTTRLVVVADPEPLLDRVPPEDRIL